MFNMIKNLFRKDEVEERLPETFEEAVEYLYCCTAEKTLSDPAFHLRNGMWVRDHLGLWQKDSKLYKHMQERFGLCHADDTGSLIVSAVKAKKRGEDYDPTDDVNRFKQHWLSMGYDPKTMERLEQNTSP